MKIVLRTGRSNRICFTIQCILLFYYDKFGSILSLSKIEMWIENILSGIIPNYSLNYET